MPGLQMETGYNIYKSRLTNITSQATNSSTARAVQHQGNPTIPASAQVASVEVCGAGRPHRFPLPVVTSRGNSQCIPCPNSPLEGAPQILPNFRNSPTSTVLFTSENHHKIWQAPVQLRVESQLFLHMTCHFDGSKLYSTPSPGSVSPQI